MPEYFTLTELKALPDMSSETDVRIEAAAAWAVAVIEREVGTSFVSRTVVETHDGTSTGAIVLASQYVLGVTSVTEGGVAVAGVTARDGILTKSGGSRSFATGTGNVVVTYAAGYSTAPPADVKEAALQATRWHLLEGRAANTVNARQTSHTDDLGGTVTYAVAGADRPTGYPDVDAVIVGWRDKLDMPAFGFA